MSRYPTEENEECIEDPIERGEFDVFVPAQPVSDCNTLIKRITSFDFMSLGGLIATFLFNALPIYFAFIHYSLTSSKKRYLRDPDRKKAILYLCAFDCYIASCIIIITLLYVLGSLMPDAYRDPVTESFYGWSMNAWILSVLHNLMVAFEETYIPDEKDVEDFNDATDFGRIFTTKAGQNSRFHWRRLWSTKNYLKMGLGLFKDKYIKGQRKSTLNTVEYYRKKCLKEVEAIVKRNHVDQTFAFMTLSNEQHSLIKELQSIYNTSENVEQDLKKMLVEQVHDDKNWGVATDHMFIGQYNIITNFIVPHYIYTRKFQQSDIVKSVVIAVAAILIKICVPVLVYIRPFNLLAIFYTIVFLGFYLHYITQLLETFKNDDLKIKNYILLALIRLIDVEDFSTNSDRPVINVSCKMSLLSWDQARHIVVQLEGQRLFQNNFMYLFLVMYGKVCLITYLTCTAQQYTYVNLGRVCTDAILVYNDHVDLVLVALASLYRVYYGSMFNDTFDEIREKIQRINGVYEDLSTTFDYYFTPGIAPTIKSELYNSVVNLLVRQSIIEFSTHQGPLSDDDPEAETRIQQLQDIINKKIDELITTTKKINRVLKHDENQFSDQFLGFYHSDFDKAQQIVSLLLASFVPTIFNAVMKYLNHIQ